MRMYDIWKLIIRVYDVIAGHFSSTRYKVCLEQLTQPWPLVSDFFDSLPAGSVGVDLGCGNGKYLHLRSALGSGEATKNSLVTLGSDRCLPLIQTAQYNFPQNAQRRLMQEVAVADALCSGYRGGVFDYALSIATIHHFSTPERRRHSIEELIRLVKPAPEGLVGTGRGCGRFMVYVWAFEQRGAGRRLFDAQLAGHGDATKAQDVLVPWVRTPQHTHDQKQDVHHRYYHLFREHELDELVNDAAQHYADTGIRVVKETGGWEKGNWWGVWRVVQR